MNADSVRDGRLRTFGEHNAPRRCAADGCEADAIGYLSTETVSTAFVCREHADLAESAPDQLAAALGGATA